MSKVQNEQQRVIATTGKFLVVWRKRAGEWKAIIDIDNADQ